MADNLKHVATGADPMASDVQQIIDALTGQNDVGGLSLFAQIVAPASAPTVAVNTTAGNLNGAYLYKVTFCSGYVDGDGTVRVNGETPGSPTSASVAPVNQQVNLTNIPLGPAGTVARRIYRTAAGGADGTQKLLTTITDNATTAYTDNLADGSLGTAVPTGNTTGTSLTLDASTGQFVLNNVQPDQTQVPASPGKGTLAQVLSWVTNRIVAITGGTNWWDAPIAALSALWAKFNASTGHKHTGAANDAPLLPPSSISPQGSGSGLGADTLDGYHAADLDGRAQGHISETTTSISGSSGTWTKQISVPASAKRGTMVLKTIRYDGVQVAVQHTIVFGSSNANAGDSWNTSVTGTSPSLQGQSYFGTQLGPLTVANNNAYGYVQAYVSGGILYLTFVNNSGNAFQVVYEVAWEVA